MDKRAAIKLVKKYLSALPDYGIHPKKAVLFGSYAKGNHDEWSDIDLIVIAPEFDTASLNIELVKNLWIANKVADHRIEPIPCGDVEWETDDSRIILEIARGEGIEIGAS